MKFLFVNDNYEWLKSINRALRDRDVLIAECHDIEEVINVVKKHNPDILFLDHSLTEDGNEGLKIVDLLRNRKIKIFSITGRTDRYLLNAYKKLGVEHVNPNNLREIEQVIKRSKKQVDS